jgi:hypothetical protein
MMPHDELLKNTGPRVEARNVIRRGPMNKILLGGDQIGKYPKI